MKRAAILLSLLLALLIPPAVASAATCQFVLGFATLAAAVPEVGQCVDNQAYAPNGDAIQHTTGGELVWRKADNWTAFTDGYHTWVNGPYGLQERLNTEQFCWEAGTPCDDHGRIPPPPGYVYNGGHLAPQPTPTPPLVTDPEGQHALRCWWQSGIQFEDAYFSGRMYECLYTNGLVFYMNASGTRLIEALNNQGWSLTPAGCVRWPAYCQPSPSVAPVPSLPPEPPSYDCTTMGSELHCMPGPL